ncbi:hypothetical protein [Kineococcus sp. SYSU DK002]|uniref:hypothetical protein n=1 Tax=Kineococcus sp. SYSU DK002 TaxID=3383123 RepID=UPI003D7EBA5E
MDETVLRMAEREDRPIRLADGVAVWGDLDVVQTVTVQAGRFVITSLERDEPRIDFTTDDAEALNRYLLVDIGESWRLRHRLPIVLTDQYPSVPEGFDVRPESSWYVSLSWTAEDGRTVTAGRFRLGAERRFANVCRVPLPVLEAALLDDSGRPQPLF